MVVLSSTHPHPLNRREKGERKKKSDNGKGLKQKEQ